MRNTLFLIIFAAFFLSSALAHQEPNYKVKQGDILLIPLAGNLSLENLEGYLEVSRKKYKLSFFKKGEQVQVIVAADLYFEPGIYKINVYDSDSRSLIFDENIKIEQGKFQKSVSKEWNKREWTKEEKERIAKEHAQLNKVFESNEQQPFWLGGLVYPIDKTENTGQITSPFGQFRINPENNKKRFHHGTDFKAPNGFPIKVIASGKVAYVGYNLFLEGNITIIDHGLGIFSLYLHQSEISVEVNRFVEKGEAIGKVGNTGNSNAPHLHLAVRVNNMLVDPIKLIESLK